MRIIVLVFMFFTYFIPYTFSQEVEAILNKNSISINLFGTSGIAGISYERLIANRINIEAGFGAFGFGGGATYYPLSVKENRINPYLGIKHNTIIVTLNRATYLPIGATYVSKWKINFGGDIGFAYYPKSGNETMFKLKENSEIGYLWNVKIGYRF